MSFVSNTGIQDGADVRFGSLVRQDVAIWWTCSPPFSPGGVPEIDSDAVSLDGNGRSIRHESCRLPTLIPVTLR